MISVISSSANEHKFTIWVCSSGPVVVYLPPRYPGTMGGYPGTATMHTECRVPGTWARTCVVSAKLRKGSQFSCGSSQLDQEAKVKITGK
eukprot:2694299-Rhodomonas_salina.1